ncbi:hypothetical protein SELMODRAFT_137550 [Selaginella moellendorffii]|uniref:Pentacotripeptide-repeat region of PRORP domain-containing protein n=1 Tax=Selaginella moellendorffii TaxID=88036 RepID=D8TDV7_SELML|nr:hypothetical protein SELMODRAFT_137550 [Selaginella moellendorffii]
MPSRDEITWTDLIRAFGDHGVIEQARNIFDRMPRWDVVAATCLLTANAQAGHLKCLKCLFDSLPRRDIVSWNATLAGYRSNGCVAESMELLARMPQHNALSCTAAIAACAENHRLDDARVLFDRMPFATALASTILVSSYAQAGRIDDSKSVFDRLEARTVVPHSSVVSWTAMVVACAEGGQLDRAEQAFRSMPARDIDSAIAAWTSMVTAYARAGRVDLAKELFDRSRVPSPVLCNAMIAAYAQNGHHREVFQGLVEMSLRGIRADTITFVLLLMACSHRGLADKSRDFFVAMVADYGVAPCSEHYNCVVDALGRSGRVLEAEDLVAAMPILPHSTACRSLLGACRIHGEMEMGQRAARGVIGLEESSGVSSDFVLLSNIYSALHWQ